MRLPSIKKNPRKYKKAWKKAIVKNALQTLFNDDVRLMRQWKFRLRWNPGSGWIATTKRNAIEVGHE